MDKTTVIDVKSNRCRVHRATTKMPRFNADYGLWIISFQRRAVYPKSQKPAPRYFEFYGLSHLLEGEGWYWTPSGGRKLFTKGYGVLSTPGTIQDYGGHDCNFVEDSICFTGPVASHLHKSGIIRDGIMKIGSVRRLLHIFDLATDPSHDSQIKANFELQKLLLDCYFKAKTGSVNDNYPLFSELFENIRQAPEKWWNTDEMARLCDLSENQFRVVFKKQTGISPKQYIIQVKMKRASEYLSGSSDTIATIAAMLGYRDPYHFSRCFKNVTGMAPEYYRRHYTIA